jgi:spermidine synthase
MAPGTTILLCCLFLSGVAGLIYEVVWTRVLGISFGHTVWAMTTVLAVFMGGLAAGSLLFGRVADRVRRPIVLYGLLEVALGLYCLFGPALLELSRQAELALAGHAGGSLAARTGMQFVAAALALAVPTTLMGGTVPAAARALIRRPVEAGRRFGRLYGANTLGAALGAALAGYWLLPAVGIRNANLLAAAINIAVGVAATAAWRLFEPARDENHAGAIDAPSPEIPVAAAGRLPRPLLAAAFFLTGSAAMVFQVAWVRALILVIGSSTYAYSAVLVTILAGLAAGSFVAGRLRAPGPTTCATILAGVGIAGAATLPLFDSLPGLFLHLFRFRTGNYGYIQLVQFLLVFPVALLPSVLMGMSLPCLAGLAVRDGRTVGADLGRLYSLNTAGSIAGSVAAGFLMIPFLGAQRTLASGAAAELLLAGALIASAEPRWRRAAPAAAVVTSLALFALPAWNRGAMNLGAAVRPGNFLAEGAFAKASKELAGTLLFEREGISSNVAVFGAPDGARWFSVNGKVDGGTRDMRTQVNLGLIPMALVPRGERIAVLGLGTGVTAATALLFEEARTIDVVELEPAVSEAARFFERENGRLLADPRTRLHFEDGRSFFAARRGAFDVVVSEPSNPWIAGVANLYTRESFREMRAALAPGGVFGLWVQCYTITPEAYALILRTFLDVFPDSTLWLVSSGDTLIVGRNGGTGPASPADFRARLRGQRRLAEALGEPGELSLDPLRFAFLLDADGMRRFAGIGPVNTDDLNALEFATPRSLYRTRLNRLAWELARHRPDLPPPFLALEGGDPASFVRRAAEFHNADGSVSIALKEFESLPSIAPPLPSAAAVVPAGGLRERFDGAPVLPFVPTTDRNPPERQDVEGMFEWRAEVAQVTRTSGVVRGAGPGGKAALVLRASPGGRSGYAVPVDVEPSTGYTVRFKVRCNGGEEARAGVSLLEFDSREGGNGQPGDAFARRHLVGRSEPAEVPAPSGWGERSFAFRTSPRTTRLRLFFHVRGAPGSEAAFDDIAVTPASPGGDRL